MPQKSLRRKPRPFPRKRTPLEQRFWAKVPKSSLPNGCWIWTGYTQASGHGQINTGGQHGTAIGVHRLSYMLAYGLILPGIDVLHNCPSGDNPACVNPKHLFLGTRSDNTYDAIGKGRMTCGENHYNAIVTPAIVKEMRRLYEDEHIPQKTLRVIFGLKQQHVFQIVHYKTWKHI